MIEPVRLEVIDGGRATPLLIGAGVVGDTLRSELDRISPEGGRAVLIARRVAALWGDRVRAATGRNATWIELDDSEGAKSLETASSILDQLFEAGLRRDWTIICVGGGVTGDIGGFVASIALRGVALVHVPTTLLAQVDSSIGGKTGVNHRAGKNLIGSFHPAAAVVSDIELLSTLEGEQIRSGLFEALKAGVIADDALFDLVASSGAEAPAADKLQDIVVRSAAIKSRIVTGDPRETGERRLLNYGHTLGHALEKVLDYRGISHGEAVGRGMLAANAIGMVLGITPPKVAERITAAVHSLAPAPLPRQVTADELIVAAQLDKKFDTRRMRAIVPRAVGDATVVEIHEEHLRAGAEAMVTGR